MDGGTHRNATTRGLTALLSKTCWTISNKVSTEKWKYNTERDYIIGIMKSPDKICFVPIHGL